MLTWLFSANAPEKETLKRHSDFAAEKKSLEAEGAASEAQGAEEAAKTE